MGTIGRREGLQGPSVADQAHGVQGPAGPTDPRQALSSPGGRTRPELAAAPIAEHGQAAQPSAGTGSRPFDSTLAHLANAAPRITTARIIISTVQIDST